MLINLSKYFARLPSIVFLRYGSLDVKVPTIVFGVFRKQGGEMMALNCRSPPSNHCDQDAALICKTTVVDMNLALPSGP